MSDEQLLEIATEFRDGILEGNPSQWMCFAVSAPLAGLLQFYGVPAKIEEGDLGECNHIWIRLEDGRVLDPTADQFNVPDGRNLPPVYLGERLDIHPEPTP